MHRAFLFALYLVVGLIVGLGWICARCAGGSLLDGDKKRRAALSTPDFFAARIVRHLQNRSTFEIGAEQCDCHGASLLGFSVQRVERLAGVAGSSLVSTWNHRI